MATNPVVSSEARLIELLDYFNEAVGGDSGMALVTIAFTSTSSRTHAL